MVESVAKESVDLSRFRSEKVAFVDLEFFEGVKVVRLHYSCEQRQFDVG